MAASDRPGGLTALAVINFIFCMAAGMVLLSLLASRFVNFDGHPDQSFREQMDQFQAMPWSQLGTLLGLAGLESALLLVSGIGYLKQSRWFGWGMGNACALVSLAFMTLSFEWLPPHLGGERVTLETIRASFYPLFTLLLLNGTFRSDFR